VVRRGREFWKQVVGEVERGERIADVARRHRVQPRTLTWWRWKLRAEGAIDTRLLPVVVSPAQARVESEIELRIRDVIMRVGSGSDVAYVAALVDALRA
jgi:transposase-like protein